MTTRLQRGILTAVVATTLLGGPAAAQDLTAEQSIEAAMAGGAGAVWTARQVNLRVYTDDYWRPIVEQKAEEIQDAMPARGPRIRVIQEPERSCDAVEKLRFSQPTITVCSKPEANYAGSAMLHQHRKIVKNERAWLTLIPAGQGFGYDVNTACHELMHGVSWVNDNYSYRQDSCVQGGREDPGPWDVAFLAQAYGDHDTKANRRRAERREERQDERRQNGRRSGKHGGRNH